VTFTPTFRRGASFSRDLVLVPLIENAVQQCAFPKDFTVRLQSYAAKREPDGWFHPSTHPTMDERKLYYYLARPEKWDEEEFDYGPRMSVLVGTVMHEVVQTVMTKMGLLVPPKGTCVCCRRPHGKGKDKCDEWGVRDDLLGRRGHIDGLLDLPGWSDPGGSIFDLKCLTPDVPVSYADGTVRPAGEVKVGDVIVGWDEENDKLVPCPVKAVWDNGIQPVWSVKTREGREITTTDEHPFYTQRGWVFAKDLKPGDMVKTAFESGWFQGEEGDPDRARFLGVLIGDGTLYGRAPRVTSVDEGVLAFMREHSATFGARLTPETLDQITYTIRMPRSGGKKSPLLAFLREEGMLGQTSHTKRVPTSVWKGGPAAWAAFLSGYFDADGSVCDKASYPHLKWSSVNRALLQDCQLLLGYLGIRSSVTKHVSRYKGEPHISWTLYVRDSPSVRRAQKVLMLKSAKAERLAALKPKQAPLKGKGAHLAAQPGWDQVSEVGEKLARPTVGIEIDGGTHVTNGLVTHNTCAPPVIRGIESHDLDAFKLKWPKYYGQAQDYMALTGKTKALVLFMAMSEGWKMIEFTIPRDDLYIARLEAKYRTVRRHVEWGTPPPVACCSTRAAARKCPATACPVKIGIAA